MTQGYKLADGSRSTDYQIGDEFEVLIFLFQIFIIQ